VFDGSPVANMNHLDRHSFDDVTVASDAAPTEARRSSTLLFDEVFDGDGERSIATACRLHNRPEPIGTDQRPTVESLMVDVVIVDDGLDVGNVARVEHRHHRDEHLARLSAHGATRSHSDGAMQSR
jgi:hypothetical protein